VDNLSVLLALFTAFLCLKVTYRLKNSKNCSLIRPKREIRHWQ